MSTVIFALGLPGSGKTTWVEANSTGAHVISFDDIRRDIWKSLHPLTLPPDKNVYEAIHEAEVLGRGVQKLRSALFCEERTIIVDEAFTVTWPFLQMVTTAHHHGAKTYAVLFNTPADVCWKNREKTGFPKPEFMRKWDEWDRNRDEILSLVDDKRDVKSLWTGLRNCRCIAVPVKCSAVEDEGR